MIEQLYQKAVDLPSASWKGFLSEECSDETVRKRVMDMLEAGNGFLSPIVAWSALPMDQTTLAKPGDEIRQYEIVKLIGKGGMGEVFLAKDTLLHRNVALKFLFSGGHLEAHRNRIIHEAKAIAAINHPNVVAIYELVEHEGTNFLVMEYVEGEKLSERLSKGPLEAASIVDIGIQIGNALEAAHSREVIHRDIKPGNLIVTSGGQVKVLDFGIAKIIQRAPQLSANTAATSAGLGSWGYASPEQIASRQVDHRTDLYSLGVVLFELATGRRPGTNAGTLDTFDQELLKRKVTGRFCDIVERCLRTKPGNRYSSARELVEDLTRIQEKARHSSWSNRGRNPLGTAYRHARWIVPTLAVLFGIVFALTFDWGWNSQNTQAVGRAFVRSSSEGHAVRRIALNHPSSFLAVSRDGGKLFVADENSHEISILRTHDFSTVSLTLPRGGGPIAVSPNGRVYIGSRFDDTLVVVDGKAERLINERIPIGGPVLDMALTPDGERLYLAQSSAGLKRLSVRSGAVKSISDRICPEGVDLDAQGHRLFVAYQCAGPEGSPGHDTIEIYDLKDEQRVATVGGSTIPMIGNKPSISPDGKLVLLNGGDACVTPEYDHVGCRRPPSNVFHLLDGSDYRLIHSLEYDVKEAQDIKFLDDAHFVVTGRALLVIDAKTFESVERMEVSSDPVRSIAFSPDRRRAFVGFSQDPAVLVLELDPGECSRPESGSSLFYPGDGTFADAAGKAALTANGSVSFVPGRIGRAFYLNGKSFLQADWTGHYKFGWHDYSLTLYVKFASVAGEMELFNWTDGNPMRGMRLRKTTGNLLTVESGPDGGKLTGATVVSPGIWYHVAVTRMDTAISLYIDGHLEQSAPPPQGRYDAVGQPLYFGAHDGRPAFQGWLDEMSLYNRSLTQQEIHTRNSSRQAGPCKL